MSQITLMPPVSFSNMSTSLFEKKNHLLPDLFLSTHIPAPPEAELRVPTGAGEGDRAPASHGDPHPMRTRIPWGPACHGDPHPMGNDIPWGPTSHRDLHPTGTRIPPLQELLKGHRFKFST